MVRGSFTCDPPRSAPSRSRATPDACPRRALRQGWVLDGRPATAPAAEALDALAETLASVRALDAFRPGDRQALGLDPARATVTVRTRRGDQRLRLGATNASGGALYVERDGHPRAFLVGTGLLSSLDRVFYQRDLATSPEAPEAGAPPAAP